MAMNLRGPCDQRKTVAAAERDTKKRMPVSQKSCFDLLEAITPPALRSSNPSASRSWHQRSASKPSGLIGETVAEIANRADRIPAQVAPQLLSQFADVAFDDILFDVFIED